MRIFLCWLGIICCSAANGFLFERYDMPENFIFMFVISIICGTILLFHRKVSKSWKAPIDPWADWSEYHFPIFWITLFICVVAFIVIIVMPVPHKLALLIGLGTAIIASFIAYRREGKYTDIWIL